MVHVHPRCHTLDCNRRAYYNLPRQVKAICCPIHKKHGMINITKRVCAKAGCLIEPCYNFQGSRKPIYCVTHKDEEMIDVKNRRCDEQGCDKQPSFKWNDIRNRIDERYCAEHRVSGMISYRKCYVKLPNHDHSQAMIPVKRYPNMTSVSVRLYQTPVKKTIACHDHYKTKTNEESSESSGLTTSTMIDMTIFDDI